MNRKSQLGFGLGLGGSFSDTLVTLAILGILGYIAVTNYGDYRARVRVLEALGSAAMARTAVEQAFAAKGPADMSQTAVTNWTAPVATEHLQSVTIGKDGTITLRFAQSVAPQGQNEIRIVPVSGGQPVDLSLAANAGRKFEWQCGGPAGQTTLAEKFRPKDCR
jgi:type II secretory pathway pseudopilin PulG